LFKELGLRKPPNIYFIKSELAQKLESLVEELSQEDIDEFNQKLKIETPRLYKDLELSGNLN